MRRSTTQHIARVDGRMFRGRLAALPTRGLRRLSTVAEVGGKHDPFGATGEGNYTALTKGCFDVIARCTPIVLGAIDRALDVRK